MLTAAAPPTTSRAPATRRVIDETYSGSCSGWPPERQSEVVLDLEHDDGDVEQRDPGDEQEGARLEEAGQPAGLAVASERQRGQAARREHGQRVDRDVRRAIEQCEAERLVDQESSRRGEEAKRGYDKDEVEPPHGEPSRRSRSRSICR